MEETWVIVNSARECWSNGIGWTDSINAERFTHMDKDTLDLPLGGRWETLASAIAHEALETLIELVASRSDDWARVDECFGAIAEAFRSGVKVRLRGDAFGFHDVACYAPYGTKYESRPVQVVHSSTSFWKYAILADGCGSWKMNEYNTAGDCVDSWSFDNSNHE